MKKHLILATSLMLSSGYLYAFNDVQAAKENAFQAPEKTIQAANTDEQALVTPETNIQAANTDEQALVTPETNIQAANTDEQALVTPEKFDKCKVLVEGFTQSYSGACLNGLAHGTGLAEGDDGVYNGEFQQGYFEGYGELRSFLDGRTYRGQFKNGQRHGTFRKYDSASGYERLALFQNGQFVRWEDKVTQPIASNRYTSSSQNFTKSLETPTQKSSNIYIGMMTPFGEIIALDANTFTTEQRITGADGYDKVRKQRHPLYLLK